MKILLTPRADCKACHGGGMLAGDSVPYGSTTASLPDEFCDCVLEQLPDDGDYDIKLTCWETGSEEAPGYRYDDECGEFVKVDTGDDYAEY